MAEINTDLLDSVEPSNEQEWPVGINLENIPIVVKVEDHDPLAQEKAATREGAVSGGKEVILEACRDFRDEQGPSPNLDNKDSLSARQYDSRLVYSSDTRETLEGMSKENKEALSCIPDTEFVHKSGVAILHSAGVKKEAKRKQTTTLSSSSECSALRRNPGLDLKVSVRERKVDVGDATATAANTLKSNPEVGGHPSPARVEINTQSLCTFQCDRCDFSATAWNKMRVHLGEHNYQELLEEKSSKPRVLDPFQFAVVAKFHKCELCNKKLLQDNGILTQHVLHSHELSIYDYRGVIQ